MPRSISAAITRSRWNRGRPVLSDGGIAPGAAEIAWAGMALLLPPAGGLLGGGLLSSGASGKPGGVAMTSPGKPPAAPTGRPDQAPGRRRRAPARYPERGSMASPQEDRQKQRRERRAALRTVEAAVAEPGVTSEPAPGSAPWPEAAPDPAEEPDPEQRGARGGGNRRRRRRRRGRGGAEAVVAAPGPLPARARPRHWGALAGFLLLVLLPFAAATAYLFTRAADQYHSEVAFSVRSEEVASASAGILGALTQIGGGSAPDAAILYDYIRSQEIVAAVDAELDLRTIWNRPGSGWEDGDPVFTLGADPTIEALHGEWLRMVTVSYDTAAGIIDVTARAFTPEDAHAIAEAILVEFEPAGEPARRPGARGRGALRPRGARRGRGAPRRDARTGSPPSAASTASSTPRPTSPGRAGS